MKKLLIGLGTILIMVCVVILFVNASGSKKDSRKAKTEAVTNKASGTGSAACCPAGAEKAAATTAKECTQMGSCTATCGSKTTGAK
jgi:hypothetical protein